MDWRSDAERNRVAWTKANAEHTDGSALAQWRSEPHWGVWRIPEVELGLFGDVSGLDVVELGCGTAYVSAWLARLGARPTGVDITGAQLDSARRCMRETGIEFPLVEADAGATGLPDASADLVISEFGASIWVDPYRWIPEAARLLRPEGRLLFLCTSVLAVLCTPEGSGSTAAALGRPMRGLHRLDWGEEGVEFTLPHGERIDLLRANGFDLERLVELYAPAGAVDHEYYDFVPAWWARDWAAEEIWVARKR
ncbi:MAG: class I SAM-dependent methyltransferase [Actinobacteria bacterium]|nr:class I SAM-dependent methyltransferase [Actinomycetota bacterium]